MNKKEKNKRLKETNDLYDEILDIDEMIDELKKKKELIILKRKELLEIIYGKKKKDKKCDVCLGTKQSYWSDGIYGECLEC